MADGENGLLADVDDPDELAAALGRVCADPSLVARLRDAGRRTAEATSHEALAPRWEALLDGFAERIDG